MAHSHGRAHDTVKSIRIAFLLNLGFTLVEVVGGLLTNSLAILSDALHDLGDSFSLGLGWVLERRSHRGSDARYSYGYRRLSLLGALINAVLLIVGSLYVLSEAIPRLLRPEHANARGMALLAAIGILINGAAMFRLRRGGSLNAQAIAWHLLEDVLGWVAVLAVSISLLFADIHILDPILSILMSLYVLYGVVRTLRRTLSLFLQAVPDAIEIPLVERALRSIPGVRSVHHTHVWSLDGEHHVLTTHLVVDADTSKEGLIDIRRQVKAATEGMALEHVTVEIEYEDEGCAMDAGKG